MRAMAATEEQRGNPTKGPDREKVTVLLIAKAAGDLKRTHERSGLSKTDIVNRAVTLYEFVDSRLAAGDEIILRSKATGDLELIRLL